MSDLAARCLSRSLRAAGLNSCYDGSGRITVLSCEHPQALTVVCEGGFVRVSRWDEFVGNSNNKHYVSSTMMTKQCSFSMADPGLTLAIVGIFLEAAPPDPGG